MWGLLFAIFTLIGLAILGAIILLYVLVVRALLKYLRK